jgi:dynactin 5
MNLLKTAPEKNKEKSTSSVYLSDLEQATEFFNSEEYLSTSSGNIISRKSVLFGTQNIHLHGKTIIAKDSIIRGDLSYIRIGRYCILDDGCVIRPPHKRFTKGFHFIPLNIGNYVYVGKNSVISAAQIGSHVMIGQNCVISPLCILRDCCEIMDGSVLAPGTVVPPFSRYGGVPAKLVCELPQCSNSMIKEHIVAKYNNFQPQ